jgi:hypothetical protein
MIQHMRITLAEKGPTLSDSDGQTLRHDCHEQMPLTQQLRTDACVLPGGEPSAAEETTTEEEAPGVLGPAAEEEITIPAAPWPRYI